MKSRFCFSLAILVLLELVGFGPSCFRLDVAAQAPKLEIQTPGNNQLLLRVSGEQNRGFQMEASSDLSRWSFILQTNLGPAGVLDLLQPYSSGGDSRFFRAITMSPTNSTAATGTIRFISPAPFSVVTNNTPVLELEIEGPVPAPEFLWFKINGTLVPVDVTLQGKVARAALILPLSDGITPVNAMLVDTNFQTRAQARLTFYVAAEPVNHAPVAVDDSFVVNVGIPRKLGVLTNDFEPDNEAIELLSVSTTRLGSAIISGRDVAFDPGTNTVGRDRLFYVIRDPRGERATGSVDIVLRPPATRVAYVVDSPVAINEFRTLGEALTHVCSDGTGGRGRVVVRTRRALKISTLDFSCPVDLEAGEEGSRLEGGAMVFNCPSDFSLSGFVLAASGSIQFNVGADLHLAHNVMTAESTIQLQGQALARAGHGGGARPAAGGTTTHNVVVESNSGTDFKFKGPAGGDSLIDFSHGDANSVQMELQLTSQAKARVETSHVSDLVRMNAVLEAEALTETRAIANLTALENSVEFKGNNRTSVESVVSGRIQMDVKGVGQGEVVVKNTRADVVDMRSDAARILHRSENNFSGILNWRFAEGGTAVDARVEDDRAEVGGRTTIHNGPNGKVDFKGRFNTYSEELTAESEGEFKFALTDSTKLGAGARLKAVTGVMDAELRDVAADGEVFIEAGEGTRVGVAVHKGIYSDDVGMTGPSSATLNVQVDTVDFINGASALISAVTSLGQSPEPSPFRRTAGPVAATPDVVVLNNLKFTGDPAEPGPRVTIHGVDGEVTVMNCLIEGTSGQRGPVLLVSECEQGIRLVKNRLVGGGLTVDGDIEDEGRTGLAPGPVLIEDNQISEGNPVHGLVVQDQRGVVIRKNEIRAQRGIDVTAGQATLDANIVELTGLVGVGLTLGSGPNGTAAVIATGNRVMATLPITLLSPVSARFEGNTFGAPPGALGGTNTVFALGSSRGLNHVIFRGNTLEGGSLIVPAFGWTLIENNTWSGSGFITCVPSGATDGSGTAGSFTVLNNRITGSGGVAVIGRVVARIAGNQLGASSLIGVAGVSDPCLADVQDNQLGPLSEISIGNNGFARVTGNSLPEGSIADTGFLLVNPGGNGVSQERIHSPIDFNGNGCRDFPIDEFGEDGECVARGIPIPRPPTLTGMDEPPWPL